MTENIKYIYRTSGFNLGFLYNNNIFSRDGQYLGWVEKKYAWDTSGNYRGELTNLNGNIYILKNLYMIEPIPRIPKVPPVPPVVPNPPVNIVPIVPPIGYIDGF